MAKVRKGFVSNSSSSSFIVAFPKGFEPTTQSVADLLFGGTEGSQHYYDYRADHAVMARVIADDMQSQNPNDPVAIVEEVMNDVNVNMDSYKIGGPNKYEYDWSALRLAEELAANKEIDKLMTKWVDKDIYVFEYSDGDGSLGCCMEHGGTFDAVEHFRISKH